MDILKLPNEILCKILGDTNLSVRLVCKRFKQCHPLTELNSIIDKKIEDEDAPKHKKLRRLKRSIRKNPDKVYWGWLSRCNILTETFIHKHRKKLDWDWLCRFKMSEPFMRQHKRHLDWENISEFQKLSTEFINDFESKLDWHMMSDVQILTEDQIEEHSKKVNWNIIFRCQKHVSPTFLEKHVDKKGANWNQVFMYHTLPIEFIKKHTDKVHWTILKYQFAL